MVTWLDTVLQHEGIVTTLIATSGTIVVTILGKAFGFWTFVGKQVEIALDRRRKRLDSEPHPPPKTMILAEDVTVVPAHIWQIDCYDADGPATGFKAFLVVTCLIPRVKITAIGARLPFRYRKHRVLHTLLDPLQKSRGLSTEMSGTVDAAVNFYVRPPIVSEKPVAATVRLRDQFSNWLDHRVTFIPER